MNTPAIQISGLKKSYDNVHALNGVNIQIEQGQFFGLLGPNGAGKTTTINILTGLVRRDEGESNILGKDTVKDYRFTRSQVGIAAQELSVDWFFPIEKLLYFQAGYYGIPAKKAKPQIDQLLDRMGLMEKKGSRLRQLSGGMKRRFQLAKALVHDPNIIILDEPTAGVDVELRHDLWQYLRDLHSDGKTILLTTHYIEEAELLCEKVAIIDNGKILKEGTPKELTRELRRSGITIHLSGFDKKLIPCLNEYTYTQEKNRLHFTVDDPDSALPNIIKQISSCDIHIQSVESSSSSLEDVFLHLTGKGINQ